MDQTRLTGAPRELKVQTNNKEVQQDQIGLVAHMGRTSLREVKFLQGQVNMKDQMALWEVRGQTAQDHRAQAPVEALCQLILDQILGVTQDLLEQV